MQRTDKHTEKQKKGDVFGLLSRRPSLYNLTSVIQLPDCQLVLLTLLGREKGTCTNCQMFYKRLDLQLSVKYCFFSNAETGSHWCGYFWIWLKRAVTNASLHLLNISNLKKKLIVNVANWELFWLVSVFYVHWSILEKFNMSHWDFSSCKWLPSSSWFIFVKMTLYTPSERGLRWGSLCQW